MPSVHTLKQRKSHDDATFDRALKTVEKGVSVYRYSKEFKISLETLRGWVSNLHIGPMGWPRQLGDQEEEKLLIILYLADAGQPVGREVAKNIVGSLRIS